MSEKLAKIEIKGEKGINIWTLLESREAMEYEGDGQTNCNGCTWNDPQRIDKGTGKLRNERTSRDHPNYSITKIGQNTEKSPGELRRLAVYQTPVKNHQLTLVWKTLKGLK